MVVDELLNCHGPWNNWTQKSLYRFLNVKMLLRFLGQILSGYQNKMLTIKLSKIIHFYIADPLFALVYGTV